MALSQRRLLQLFAFLSAWAIVVVIRLVHIQVVKHDHYVARARQQQEWTISLNPVRGSILDSRGRVLAESVGAESIYADPQAIEDKRAIAKKLAAVDGIRVSAKDIESRLRGNGSFAWIARQLPLEVAAKVRKLALPGIYFLETHRRSYPRAQLAANVVGYTGIDGNGLGGVELSVDKHVRGTPGKVTLLKDARRGMYHMAGGGEARDGNDVVLTIDSVVQFITERALSKAVQTHRASGGSAIVMDPRNGAVLAMASMPTFDPNRFREFPAAAWRNPNVHDVYEPGSTFKIITAAAGLEEGIVTPSQMVDCANGALTIGNVTIGEHDDHRYGLMTFEEVMMLSSNIGTARVGMALGQKRFHEWIRKFGFGERTGIALPGEESGLLRRAEKWTPLSSASIAFGQEISVTPLQIVRAVAAVATGGMLIEPRLIERIVDANGAVVHKPAKREPQRVMSEKTAAVLNEILKNAVARGTGNQAALAEHVVAGKTGTAQKAFRGGYMAGRYVGSFVGYVPADRPQLVILVVLDEPRAQHYGGVVAAPVFREIAEATLRYLGVPPSIPARELGVGAPLLAAFSQSTAPTSGTSGVPDLRGLDARAAVARAVASGLSVRAIGSGVVISQEPQPGGALPKNGVVVLRLAETRVATVSGPTGVSPSNAEPSPFVILSAAKDPAVASASNHELDPSSSARLRMTTLDRSSSTRLRMTSGAHGIPEVRR